MAPTLVTSCTALPPEGAESPRGGPAATRFVYLASQSPRRRQLLEQLGVRYELLLPDPDEDAESLEAPLRGEAPAAYVRRVTGLKLDAAMARVARKGLPPAPVLCSDTTVALGRTLYGKPADAADAARMLRELSGATHRVLTAVAVQWGRRRELLVSDSRVTFDRLTPAVIRAYVQSGEPLGKAGAYAIQGAAAAFIPRIAGSYTGIMGLPLHETAQLLRAARILR
jgi:septum formation protein